MKSSAKCLIVPWCLFGVIALSDRALADEGKLPDVTVKAVLSGQGVQVTNLNGSGNNMIAETVRLKSQAVRVDFDGGSRLRGSIYKLGDRTWLLPAGSSHALPVAHMPLASVTQLDPVKPCWQLGFFCQHVDDRLIAGRRASGWRYDHAGRAGPVGTDSGVMWIDAQYGILLGLAAEDTSRRAYRMEAVSIQFAAIPGEVFKVP
jgi:hypothetical protein